jgi:dienelactone hydrolase
MTANDDSSAENPPSRQPSIQAPDRSANDRPITIRITGAPPVATVEFEATLVDDDGVEWASRATFTADDEGTVDLTDHAPDSGTYTGIEPMGWFWSMRTGADARFASLDTRPEMPVVLRASVGRTTAERRVTRVLYDEGIEAHDIEGEGLVGRLFLPSESGPHPGVLNLHGAGGPRSERFARALATHGFAVCAPRYFGEPDPVPDELGRVPLSYFDDVTDWFRAHPGVRDGPLGVVGASRGAELALLLGATADWAGAVVSYAGSGVVWDTADGTPAWVRDGEPVPHISGEGPPERTDDGAVLTRPVLARGFENATDAAREAATIPVEKIDGSVLLLSGGADRVWPARRLSAVAADRLARHDHPYAFDHLTYDGCGHLVGVPYAPLPGVAGGEVTARATARAAADSWPVVLEYLEAVARDQ